jgi:hypothetical protein
MDEELNTFMEHVLGKKGRRDVDLRTTSLGWN